MKNEKVRPAASATCVIKKYPNRRLYDTCASAYVTLADVKQRVMAREPFEVRDARSGEDITRSILLQIVLEEEAGKTPLLSTEGLSSIIRCYGHAMQGVMGRYLDGSIRNLQQAQDHLAGQAPMAEASCSSWDIQSLQSGLRANVVSPGEGWAANIS